MPNLGGSSNGQKGRNNLSDGLLPLSGRAVRSSHRRHRLTLDRWGIALTIAGELQGSSRDAWRVHHDACAARMFDDALRAGIVGCTEVHTPPSSCVDLECSSQHYPDPFL